jgi:hypothetical protein
MNPKDGDARTEVGSRNTITVAMEDLPEAEKITLEKELEEEMHGKNEETGVFSEDTHRGDQEDRPGRHDYYDYVTHGNI